eukprot:6665632-Pyramimonas_sp.AAC.1
MQGTHLNAAPSDAAPRAARRGRPPVTSSDLPHFLPPPPPPPPFPPPRPSGGAGRGGACLPPPGTEETHSARPLDRHHQM